MPYTYEYPRPAVTVDAAILRPHKGRIEILLIVRGHPPFPGLNALPGGFLEMDEEPSIGAARELTEETGLSGVPLSPLFGAGKVGRDPRSRNITLVFGTLLKGDALEPKGGDDAARADWFQLAKPPKMAFDHSTILDEIHQSLLWQARTAVVGRNVLPGEFAEPDLCNLHNLIVDDHDDHCLERGLRLGLIQPGGRQGLFRFADRNQACPDWTALPW